MGFLSDTVLITSEGHKQLRQCHEESTTRFLLPSLMALSVTSRENRILGFLTPFTFLKQTENSKLAPLRFLHSLLDLGQIATEQGNFCYRRQRLRWEPKCPHCLQPSLLVCLFLMDTLKKKCKSHLLPCVCDAAASDLTWSNTAS